ncbi:MAG: DNA repair protein RecO [Planctomycetes bacterium]|nr:DNA repair protein RecO [Planctomycetota bacterium]
MLTKDTAICLRTVDYSETSQVLTLFTKTSGKIGAIAKGAKRKNNSFDGPVEILAYGPVIFKPAPNEGLATLAEFQQMPVFLLLTRKLFTLNAALFAVELTEAFTETNDPHPNLFDVLFNFLNDLQQTQDFKDATSLLIVFQLSLLSEIGARPVMKNCANCKTPLTSEWGKFYFSSNANGLICPDCQSNYQDRTSLSHQTAHCLYDLSKLTEATEATINELEKLMIRHFTHLMHRPPKTAKFFLKH